MRAGGLAGGLQDTQTQFICRHAFRVHKSQNYAQSVLCVCESYWAALRVRPRPFADFATRVVATSLVCCCKEDGLGDNSVMIISFTTDGGLILGRTTHFASRFVYCWHQGVGGGCSPLCRHTS